MDEISGIENLSDILIVDDNAHNLEVLGSMLRLQGYKARPAISGEIALRAISLMAPSPYKRKANRFLSSFCVPLRVRLPKAKCSDWATTSLSLGRLAS